MDDTAAAARWLLATHPAKDEDLPWQVREVLEGGLFTTYARAFNQSRGREKGEPGLPPAPTDGFTTEQQRVHDWAKRERDKAWAHIDLAGTRRVFTPVGSDEPLITWRPPNPVELCDLAHHAEVLALRYRQELAELDAVE